VYDALQIGLDRSPDDLDERVDERVHRMFAAGLVREVRELELTGLRSGLTASRALGYAQVLQMFDGELPEAEVVDVTARATRRFVRRQRSWFRRDDQIQWLDATRPDLVAAAMDLC
jgi:tRNA dimethylallyltransferase